MVVHAVIQGVVHDQQGRRLYEGCSLIRNQKSRRSRGSEMERELEETWELSLVREVSRSTLEWIKLV
jgi:hypothetical protein